jgi:hypothetical protein
MVLICSYVYRHWNQWVFPMGRKGGLKSWSRVVVTSEIEYRNRYLLASSRSVVRYLIGSRGTLVLILIGTDICWRAHEELCIYARVKRGASGLDLELRTYIGTNICWRVHETSVSFLMG